MAPGGGGEHHTGQGELAALPEKQSPVMARLFRLLPVAWSLVFIRTLRVIDLLFELPLRKAAPAFAILGRLADSTSEAEHYTASATITNVRLCASAT